MTALSKRYAYDLGERVLWTCAQSVLAVVATTQADWPIAYAPLIATALAVLKGLVARQVGSGHTAATLPAVDDTTSP